MPLVHEVWGIAAQTLTLVGNVRETHCQDGWVRASAQIPGQGVDIC